MFYSFLNSSYTILHQLSSAACGLELEALVAPGRSHPGLFLTLPRIASKTNGPPVVCYEGSGSALLPVLEEATSEDSTLVIVFILTV